MKKVAGLIFGFLPLATNAECVPVPDCASIGYTETSCEGDSLKCPFDTTKLYCPPCDSSYKYSCSGENVKNPIGDSCNNKYVSCECENRTTFVNGECLCDSSCDTIGNIYYSDGSCSSCNITDKTPVGIIAYNDQNKHLIMSLENNIKIPWAPTQRDLPNLTNYSSRDLALADYNGIENTRSIVEAYGENATEVAAVYCYNYAPTDWESSKGQWYLPAVGELYEVIYINNNKINQALSALAINSLNIGYYQASSEHSNYYSWHVHSAGNYLAASSKTGSSSVTCLYSL